MTTRTASTREPFTETTVEAHEAKTISSAIEVWDTRLDNERDMFFSWRSAPRCAGSREGLRIKSKEKKSHQSTTGTKNFYMHQDALQLRRLPTACPLATRNAHRDSPSLQRWAYSRAGRHAPRASVVIAKHWTTHKTADRPLRSPEN